MKKLVLTALAASTLATSAFANDFYARIDGGAARTHAKNPLKSHHVNNGLVSVGAGAAVAEGLRGELVFTHMFNKNKSFKAGKVKSVTFTSGKGKVKVMDFGVALNYDLPVELAVKPFLTAGVGMSRLKSTGAMTVGTTTTNLSSKNKNTFSWKLGAGVGYDVAENVSLDLAYAYRNFGKTNQIKNATAVTDAAVNTNLGQTKVHAHTVTLGARFGF